MNICIFFIGYSEKFLECTWGGAPCINFEDSKIKQSIEYCDTPDILNRFCDTFDKKNSDTDNEGQYADQSKFSDPCQQKTKLYFQDDDTSVNCQKFSECGVTINSNNKDKCNVFELSFLYTFNHLNISISF